VSALHDLSALDQGAAVRRGEVSPRELASHYLDRADEVGAFVTRTPELALARAASLVPVPGGAGPLYGVPTAIKDLNLTAGVRTTFGSAAFADFVPEVSDAVTLSLEVAGMVSLGKTNTPEFGSPCYTEPDVAPPAVTPWDRTRMAGGSSGGAAAAVAAGLVPVAQGSDGGGSIRIPAACCGLVGLKPTRGRISGYPMYGEVTGLATAGTLARTVRDAAALLDVLAGRRVGDPAWAPPPAEPFLASCDREPGHLRIARFVEPVITDAAVDPECVAAWETASTLLASLGHEVEDIPVPMPREAVPTFETCWAVLTALSVVPPEKEVLLRPLTTLAPYDAVLTPTLAVPPLPVGAIRDDANPAADFAAQKAFTPWTSAWNVTGMPAVSLPLHWTPEGLPVGVMLAARPAEEGLLLALAAQVEAASPWAGRHPPGW